MKDKLTDNDILQMDVVSVKDAARYLGWTEDSVRSALRESRVPFGVAFRDADIGSGKYCFRILPEPLVNFKRNGLPAVPFATLQRLTGAMLDQRIAPILDSLRELERRLK